MFRRWPDYSAKIGARGWIDDIRRRPLPGTERRKPHRSEGRASVFFIGGRPALGADGNGCQPRLYAKRGARAKTDTKLTPDGLPIHSFMTLLADLATLTLNEVTLPGSLDHAFPLMAKPTELQNRAFELLDIDPAKDVAM